MASKNKKKRKNNRKNKKNKLIKEEKIAEVSENLEHAEDEPQSAASYENLKRKNSDDDSDTEEAPKKKKKKLVAANTTDQKGKKSIRQMKREKHAQRQADAQAVAKDELKSSCIIYLSQWKHDRQNWKFMKAKQVWIYKNKFSSQLIPDSSWQILLDYFESAQGNIRNLLLEDANKVIKKMDEWTESQKNIEDKPKDGDADDDAQAPESEKPDDTSYKRARDIIQCLQE